MNSKQHLTLVLSAKIDNECLNVTYPANESLFDPKYVQFAKFLSIGMGFSYDIIGGTAGGRLQPNGTWTGVIGKVHRGVADLAISPLIITEDRKKEVNFSYPFFVDSVTFVVRKVEKEIGLTAILRPFNSKVWILLLITFMSMVTLLFLVLENKPRLSDILLKVTASLLRQPVTLTTEIQHKRVVILVWLIGSTFLSSCYTSVLLSYTMFPTLNTVSDISALSKLVSEGKYHVIVRKTSPFAELLASSVHQSISILGNSAYKSNEGLGSVDDFLKASEPNVAFIEMRHRINYLKNEFSISNDYILCIVTAIAVGKTFCCREKLDMVIHRIAASGLYEKLLRHNDFYDAFALFTKQDFSRQTSRSLTLTDLSSAFFVLIVGYILGGVFLISEILVKCFGKMTT